MLVLPWWLVRALFELLWLAGSAAMAMLLVAVRHRFDVARAWEAWEYTGPYSVVTGGVVAGTLALAIAGVRYAWVLPEVALRRGGARRFAVLATLAGCAGAAQFAVLSQHLALPGLHPDHLLDAALEWRWLWAAAFLLLACECAFATVRTAWLSWTVRPRPSNAN